MMTKTFKGTNVFMSRNLVPPELFDTLHDALKQNGADIFLCCDPLRNGPSDYHVIASMDHEKFDDLRSKGCNLLGPQCVLSCAKEHRLLPKQGYTCCLALDGVKVLASGFDMDEKNEISKLVTAMGGVLHMKASLDVSFVIVKSVLAAKYKWAVNILKKPIVNISWLYQCWKQHRIVPQDSFRVLPFSGLIICVTKVPADERKEMEKLVNQNGGTYSPELNKKCTHLVCDAPEGDKFKVAKKWGHVHIVTRKWFDQSVSRRACLNEEAYAVQAISSTSTAKASLKVQHSQGKLGKHSICSLSSLDTDANFRTATHDGLVGSDVEATLSENMSSKFPDDAVSNKTEDTSATAMLPDGDTNFDGCVADDSQTDDNDLYLSNCRISLVGFEASQTRKLVTMIRRGGGSRHISLNENLTHIVVGNPSEIEKKEARGHAAAGVISVVKTIWLEECDREKKEVPVLRRHTGYDLLIPKDLLSSNKQSARTETALKEGKSFFPDDQVQQHLNPGPAASSDKSRAAEVIMNRDTSLGANCRYNESRNSSCNRIEKGYGKIQCGPSHQSQDANSAIVFKSKLFQFSSSFPEERKSEIVQWIIQGGGEVVSCQDDYAHFIVECHGAMAHNYKINDTASTTVSSHWIKSCLEEGQLLDVGSHILYSPLTCQIPFPGFQKFRFCVSQYDEKDRLLLRNLCFVLGAKFAEKLTKRVTHLLCKFTSGPKYEAACKWGILPVKCEWVYECIKQDKVVALDSFCPNEVTFEDREAGLCTVSQYPTQAVKMASGDGASQMTCQSQDLNCLRTELTGGISDRAEANHTCPVNKRAKLSDTDVCKSTLPSIKSPINPTCEINTKKICQNEKPVEVSFAVPDVAAAIEDLLEETSKIPDQKSPGKTGCVKSLFSSDRPVLGQDHADLQSGFALSKHWINRTDKEDNGYALQDRSIYDGFSETQTESQVVGYEEDLSGRQMIIDRIRTRSSM
ncbi:uncharacterized protein LOC108214466 [Daucus carota subsp. sativus]|uniref:uncharacterized protein LOC108214466 n=1 Tax=Daucus carota subsp. sativus TaxID=79200 RepID=UPI003082787B